MFFVNPILFLGFLFTLTTFLFSCSKSKSKEDNLIQEPVSEVQFPEWMHRYSESRVWTPSKPKENLRRSYLENSYQLGEAFLVNNQKVEGNFNYLYNYTTKTQANEDSAVRQAGALWGLSLLLKKNDKPHVLKSTQKGFEFFWKNSVTGPIPGSLVIAYPREKNCETGTVALVSLALIEALKTDAFEAEMKSKILEYLNGYLKYLGWLQLDNFHFSDSYSLSTKKKNEGYNPYADGEVLLAWVKAAKYLGLKEWLPRINRSILPITKNYTLDAWKINPDSDLTKGFFQWSLMTLNEYELAGWEHATFARDYILGLSWWMIHKHKVLSRNRNTAYAFEGLISAYIQAEKYKKTEAKGELFQVITDGLWKLTTWQVGGPIPNAFIKNHPTEDILALGGVLNEDSKPELRIDVTQHQMHAVQMALGVVPFIE